MNHVDLFSGIGGFALAASWVWPDYVPLAHSEVDEFCCKVYHKHFPGSECLGDIKKINWARFAGRVDLLTGGFPCQPFSVAGKRRGKEDDRAIWPEMLRAIREIEPRWVVGENVSGLINMGLEEVLSDLEGSGYTTETFVIPACAKNAPHRRDRIWIVANDEKPIDRRHHRESEERQEPQSGKSNGSGDATDSSKQRLSKPGLTGERKLQEEGGGGIHDRPKFGDWSENWLEVATRLCRVDDGVSGRVDRLKSLGNAIVPQVAAEIMAAIKVSDPAQLNLMEEG